MHLDLEAGFGASNCLNRAIPSCGFPNVALNLELLTIGQRQVALLKLYYNLTITAVSVVVAVLIAGIETLGLIGEAFKLKGPFWDFVGTLNDNFGVLGYVIIGVFAASWIASVLIYRARGYDDLEVQARV